MCGNADISLDNPSKFKTTSMTGLPTGEPTREAPPLQRRAWQRRAGARPLVGGATRGADRWCLLWLLVAQQLLFP